jgi:hypothetical protein
MEPHSGRGKRVESGRHRLGSGPSRLMGGAWKGLREFLRRFWWGTRGLRVGGSAGLGGCGLGLYFGDY